MSCGVEDYNKLSSIYARKFGRFMEIMNILLVCREYRPATILTYHNKDVYNQLLKFISKTNHLDTFIVDKNNVLLYNKNKYTEKEAKNLYNEGHKSIGKLIGYNCPMDIMKQKWSKGPKYGIEYYVLNKNKKDYFYNEWCDRDPRGEQYLEKQFKDFKKLGEILNLEIKRQISVELPGKSPEILE
jgi:hypothetical protein